MAEKKVTVTRVIAAPAQAIFDVLADPTKHPLIDGSGSVKAVRAGGPARLALGAKFGMRMKLGLPYRIENTVTVFEEGRAIAWRHVGRHTWRYDLEPLDEHTTRVTESWDWSALGPLGKGLELLGVPQKNRAAMEKTLERLEAHLTTAG
jgi:uncharacterized protein YndB with AHSA1/START domain